MRYYLIHIILFLLPVIVWSQRDDLQRYSRDNSRSFFVEGFVRDKQTNNPIPGVDITVIGGGTTITNFDGKFRIRAFIGSVVIVSGDKINPIHHTITKKDDLEVYVLDYVFDRKTTSAASGNIYRDHQKLIDSANYYKKIDIDKSIDFIEKSLTILNGRRERQRNALSFSTLGNIYEYWKQYDLSVNSYKRALEAKASIAIKIRLGKVLILNGEFQEGLVLFEELKSERRLSSFEKINIYEGLGDAYYNLDNTKVAISNYNLGLTIAQKNLVTPKVTDLNSKLAEAYAKENNVSEAQGFFKNSLNLAKQENPKRAIEEKYKVADFLNKNSLYDEEIELRKSTLEEVKKISNNKEQKKVSKPSENLIIDNDSITAQKINYKIGNAFIAQEKYEEAIPYLEESIEEADEKEDLIVQKDATRKLSEVYRYVGDYNKALLAYQDYVNLVDELYIKKEQEISQLRRFSRDIAIKQNRITSLEKDRELSEARYGLAVKQRELSNESNKRQEIIIYSLIFGIAMLTLLAFLFYRTNKQQKLANNLLALKGLRSQMNPHFIFNALNSVNNFIAKNDERSANRYLSEFSTLMRSVLENSEEDFIPLEKEISLLELYTKLEHSRFSEKFDYEFIIDDNVAIEAFKIPPMLLQPYVENAIWHGLRYKEEKGLLTIHFSQESTQTITIKIEDNGVGRKRSALLKTDHQRRQKSKGMGNIKKRITILNNMYKDKIDVHIEDVFEDGNGTRVLLTLKKD